MTVNYNGMELEVVSDGVDGSVGYIDDCGITIEVSGRSPLEALLLLQALVDYMELVPQEEAVA